MIASALLRKVNWNIYFLYLSVKLKIALIQTTGLQKNIQFALFFFLL